MKKVYTTIFLFISLFFFYSSGVKADTLNWDISYSFEKYINENFQTYIDKANETIEEKGFNYYVILNTGSLNYIYYFNEYDGYIILNNSSLNSSSLNVVYQHRINANNTFSANGNSNTISFSISSYPYSLLYTNYNFIYSGESDFTITTSTCSYSLKNGEKVRSLYEYYVADQNSCTLESEDGPDIHSEEKEILSNFYTLVIEKINVFTTSIFSNYIYLSVIGIFILIFTIGLIRRLL